MNKTIDPNNENIKASTDNKDVTTSNINKSINNSSEDNSINSNSVISTSNRDNMIIKTTKEKYPNLVPINALTEDERREMARRAGKKSGEARRARKTMKDTILELIQKEVDTANYGADPDILGNKATLQEIILASMVREAANGDTKAMQLLRDTIGEMPITKQEIKQEVISKEDIKTMDNLKKYLTS